MKLFGPMYERTLHWARHRNATALRSKQASADLVD